MKRKIRFSCRLCYDKETFSADDAPTLWKKWQVDHLREEHGATRKWIDDLARAANFKMTFLGTTKR